MPLIWGKRAEAVRRADELIRECCQRLDLREKKLSKSGRDWIARRKWSEDYSEMRRLVYYATLTSKGNEVSAIHFPPRGRLDHEAFSGVQFESLSLEDVVRQKLDHFFERLGKVEATGIYTAVRGQMEKPLLEASLKWADGNQVKTARMLGIDRNTLRKKMREYGLDK
jgi:DNA-binding protein Fis